MQASAGKHVVVIGGGLAGLTAALEVIAHKGRVTILEKCPKLGGNSAKASSGINGAETAPQKAIGLQDSTALFKDDTIRSGKGRCNPALVDVLVSSSAAAIDSLQSLGINLNDITQCGGHSRPRTHRAVSTGKASNIGGVIMHALIDRIQAQPPAFVQVFTNTRALELLQDSQTGRVKGVRCRAVDGPVEGDRAVEADAVILATGGFCADRTGLLQEHAPEIPRLATTNGPWATGDGVKIGLAIGAGSVDLDQVQLHPTGLVDPNDPTNPSKFLAPEALRAIGGILLNQTGERFVDEAILRHCQPLELEAEVKGADELEGENTRKEPESREKSTVESEGEKKRAGELEGVKPRAAELEGEKTRKELQSGKTSADKLEGEKKRFAEEATLAPVTAFLVLNDEGIERFGRPVAEFYMKMGFLQTFASVDELCQKWRLPVSLVARTLDEYGRVERDAFGKPSAPVLFQPGQRLYTCLVTPSLHYTMGGLNIDAQGRVLTEAGDVIPGLWAAGEVAGGVHGRNRLAGNSLLECVVFGKIVGAGASEMDEPLGKPSQAVSSNLVMEALHGSV